MEILTNIFAGTLAILFFLGWHSREYLFNKTWSAKVHLKENWKRWVWTLSMLILTALIYQIIPEALDQMFGITGFSIKATTSKVLFFGFGLMYSRIVKTKIPKSE